MDNIINFDNVGRELQEKRIKQLRSELFSLCFEMFPIIDELNKLDKLELVVVDKDGLWYQNSKEQAEKYMNNRKDKLHKFDIKQ